MKLCTTFWICNLRMQPHSNSFRKLTGKRCAKDPCEWGQGLAGEQTNDHLCNRRAEKGGRGDARATQSMQISSQNLVDMLSQENEAMRVTPLDEPL